MQLFVEAPVIDGKQIIARYSFGQETYQHTFILPSSFMVDAAVTRLAEWTTLIHAVYLFSIEYFEEIKTNFALSQEEVTFFENVFNEGLAEFRYVNGIALQTHSKIIPITTRDLPIHTSTKSALSGRYLMNGGGKDGLTSGALLKDAGFDFDLFEVGSGVAQKKAAEALGKKRVSFIRKMDEKRFDGKYQGHRPTSAALAIVASLSAYVDGKQDVIVSNENSANEPNLSVNGITINHQYSKSFAFENSFSELMQKSGIGIRYFSLLRPFHELQIVKLFSKYPSLYSSFVSCNHGYRKGFWCKKCAKCAFIDLAFSAISRTMTDKVFSESNSIALPRLTSHFKELVLPEEIKPLECVGTLEECQLAAKMILDNKEMLLSSELQSLFEQASAHLSQYDITLFFNAVNDEHAIPDDYTAIIIAAKESLAS